MLHHPCILGGPQRQAHGAKSKVVPNKEETTAEVGASPLPSQGPNEGEKCYISAVFSGIANKGEQSQKWLPHPCLLGAIKRAEMLCHPCVLGDPQQRGTKSEVAASPVPSRGPKRARKCYITPAFWKIPKRGEQNENWLVHPCLLEGPKEGGNDASPLHSQISPTKGNKIRTGCLTSASSEAQKGAVTIPHRCILGDPKQRGTRNQKW